MIVIYVERGSYDDHEFYVVGAVERREDAAAACWHYAEKLMEARRKFWSQVPHEFSLHLAKDIFPADRFRAETVFLKERNPKLIGEPEIYSDDFHVSWIEVELWKP